MVLDQFSTRNLMVPFPRTHSHTITRFGNQTYLTLLGVSETLFTAIEVRSQPPRVATWSS